MKKFTALHVSDLHLSRDREREQQLALCALYKDIADYRDAGNLIDAIFFTGELLAQGGGRQTPPAYAYDHFIEPLLQAACAPGARFYLVPRSREPGAGRAQQPGPGGFSFFSTREQADAEQRAVYQSVHAVFHNRKHSGDAASLMHALGALFDSRADVAEPAQASFHGYSVLEFKGDPAPRWSVTLRRYDDAGRAFYVSARYTESGRELCPRAAPPPRAPHAHWNRQLLSHASSAIAPKSLWQMFVEPPLGSAAGRPADAGAAYRPRALGELAANDKAVFFVGGEQSGKTTLLNYLCMHANTPSAFRIDLRTLGGVSRAALLDAAARDGDVCPRAPGADVAALLHGSGAIVCFDNLALDKPAALDVLAAFVAEFAGCKFCFALGEGGEGLLESLFFPKLGVATELVRLHGFGTAEAQRLAENWFGAALAAVRPRFDDMLSAMARLDMAQTPFVLSVGLFLLERNRPFTAANRAELIAGFTGALLEAGGDAERQRDFLIELAYCLFEAKTLSLGKAEMQGFEADYFGVKGLAPPAAPLYPALCARGLLAEAGGRVSFQFDCFRTYFLAHKFNTSSDLMRYAFTQKGFMELQSELDFYTGMHRDNVEVLTGEKPASGSGSGELSPLALPDFGRYEDRFRGAEPGGVHSADLEAILILEIGKSARLQRRARLSSSAINET